MRSAQVLVRYSVLVLCFAAPFAFSQTGGGTTGGSTGGAPSAPSRQASPMIREDRRSVFLSGRVMLDDGTVPQERPAIERVCNGRVRRETHADAQGQFGFQLGAEARDFQDATVGGGSDPFRNSSMASSKQAPGTSSGMPTEGVTRQELMSCELRASLPGFRSDTISLAGRQLFDDPSVGTIVLHRVGKVEGTRISATSLQAPRNAKKAFERGQNSLKKGNKAEAAGEFSKAIELYPQYAEALAQLGDIYVNQGRSEEAKKLYGQAMQADAKFLPPYFALAMLASRERDWKAVAELSGRALALNAYEYPIAYLLDAAANYNLHNYDRAEKSARMGQRLDSQHRMPRINFLLASILMERQDYAGSAEELRVFLQYEPTGREAEAAREMLAQTQQKIASGLSTPPK
jgi:tetratricopeptide (TPR) repeat protein